MPKKDCGQNLKIKKGQKPAPHPSSAPRFNSSSWAGLDLDGAQVGTVIFSPKRAPSALS